ncbi:unnamed protein product [Mytilus edulis]|uniref:Polyprotein n=1 Tax=Mytilus edulis TaxID=6550 RepID=A0A8S3T148_MYTED|nr:unnamed protein product [Mytilus edulis]
MTACLYDLAHQTGEVEWQQCHEKAFQQSKTALISAPCLTYPNANDKFILDTDASDTTIGAVLSQLQNGEERVICFASHVLLKPQRRYCTTRKELLATFYFTHCNADGLSRIPDDVPECDCYRAGLDPTTLPCHGCKYCLRAHEQWSRFGNDVDDVIPLATKSVIASVRTVSVVAENDKDMSTDQEPTALAGDCHSDPSPNLDDTLPYADGNPCSNWAPEYPPEQLKIFQQEDPDLAPILKWMEEDVEPTQAELRLQSRATRSLWLCRPCFVMFNHVLYYKFIGCPARQGLCLVVPSELKGEVLKNCHDTKTSGHLGQKKTLDKLKQAFLWYNMRKDCDDYVSTCATCSQNKKAHVQPRAPLGQFHAGYPMERVHLDILGPFNTIGRMQKIHEFARHSLHTSQLRQKRDYDLRVVEHKYQPGDLVYKADSTTKVGQSRKLKSPWCGPFLVVSSRPPLYTIRGRKGDSVVHHDKLKLCNDRDIPTWIKRLRHALFQAESEMDESWDDLDDTIPYGVDFNVQGMFEANQPTFDSVVLPQSLGDPSYTHTPLTQELEQGPQCDTFTALDATSNRIDEPQNLDLGEISSSDNGFNGDIVDAELSSTDDEKRPSASLSSEHTSRYASGMKVKSDCTDLDVADLMVIDEVGPDEDVCPDEEVGPAEEVGPDYQTAGVASGALGPVETHSSVV